MRIFLTIFSLIIIIAAPAYAGFLDDVKKELKEAVKEVKEKDKGLSEETVIAGLKEALDVGTRKAVKKVSKLDGYYRNPRITIPFPPKVEKAAKALRKIGLDKEVDRFVLSMNRAAEKAAPKAVDIFVKSIKGMSFTDARGILEGGETAATDFFRRKTSAELSAIFRPAVSSAMNEVGVTRNFKKIMKKYASLPFVKEEYVDLDGYVTGKALEGLFLMVGEEEKKIRKDPAARVTELLKQVFGK
jgi:hypothetical protein